MSCKLELWKLTNLAFFEMGIDYWTCVLTKEKGWRCWQPASCAYFSADHPGKTRQGPLSPCCPLNFSIYRANHLNFISPSYPLRFAVEGMVYWSGTILLHITCLLNRCRFGLFSLSLKVLSKTCSIYTQRQLRVFRESHCSIQRLQQADIATFYLYFSFK